MSQVRMNFITSFYFILTISVVLFCTSECARATQWTYSEPEYQIAITFPSDWIQASSNVFRLYIEALPTQLPPSHPDDGPVDRALFLPAARDWSPADSHINLRITKDRPLDPLFFKHATDDDNRKTSGSASVDGVIVDCKYEETVFDPANSLIMWGEELVATDSQSGRRKHKKGYTAHWITAFGDFELKYYGPAESFEKDIEAFKKSSIPSIFHHPHNTKAQFIAPPKACLRLV